MDKFQEWWGSNPPYERTTADPEDDAAREAWNAAVYAAVREIRATEGDGFEAERRVKALLSEPPR